MEVEPTGKTSEEEKRPQEYFDWTDVDPGLKEDLECLGLAHEIKAIFDEVYQSGPPQFPFFPVLRYVTICSPSGLELPPEQEYRPLVATREQVPW